jgi:hypothetical protein
MDHGVVDPSPCNWCGLGGWHVAVGLLVGKFGDRRAAICKFTRFLKFPNWKNMLNRLELGAVGALV